MIKSIIEQELNVVWYASTYCGIDYLNTKIKKEKRGYYHPFIEQRRVHRAIHKANEEFIKKIDEVVNEKTMGTAWAKAWNKQIKQIHKECYGEVK